MRYYIISLFVLNVMFVNAQNDIDFELGVKEYHMSNVSDIVIDSINKEIISADYSGKILVHSALDYTYKRQLFNTNGFAIQNLTLIKQKKELLIQSKDTLYFYDLVKQKIRQAIPGMFTITNVETEPIVAIYKAVENGHQLILYDRSNFKEIKTLTTNYPVTASSVSRDGEIVATIQKINKNPGFKGVSEEELFEVNTLEIYDAKTNEVLYHEVFNADDIPATVLINLNHLELFTIPIRMYGNNMKQYQYDLTKFTKTKLKDFDNDYSFENFSIESNSLNCNLVISNTDYLISKESGDYQIVKNDYSGNQKVPHATYNYLEDEFVLFRNSPSGRRLIEGLTNTFRKFHMETPNIFNQIYEGRFLPDDSWMVNKQEEDDSSFFSKEETSVNASIRYFKKGTFFNYFSNNNFNEVIKSKGYTCLSEFNDITFDEASGEMGFLAYNPIKNQRFLCTYNFVTNELNEIKALGAESNTRSDGIVLDLDSPYTTLTTLDFNGRKNVFVLGKRIGESQDYHKMYLIKLVSPKLNLEIEGEFISAALSGDGKYLFTQTANRTINFYQCETGKLLYTKPFKYPDFTKLYSNQTAIAINENTFLVEYANAEPYDAETDNVTYNHFYYTLSFLGGQLEESEHVQIKKELSDLTLNIRKEIGDYTTNANAELLKKLTDYTQRFDVAAISLNSNHTKMLVSFKDGSIVLVDLNTMENLVVMNFINNTEHVFYSTNGSYFSNTDPSSYVYARKERDAFELSLKSNTNLYNPLEVLQRFGEVDTDYENTLKTASKIRASRLNGNLTPNIKIETIFLSDSRKSRITKTSQNRFTIQLSSSSKTPKTFQVRINNVLQNNLKFKKINSKTYQFEAVLLEGSNIVEVNAVKKNTISFPFKKEIINRNSDSEKDLYVLSVGVSKYDQSDYNLTFADKDALDISRTYGQFNEVQIDDYINRFFKSTYELKNSKIEVKPIHLKFNNLTYNSDTGLPISISENGRFWIEPREENAYLWDFELGTITPFKPNKNFFYKTSFGETNEWNSQILQGTNEGFFYITFFTTKDNEDTNSEMYYYEFKKQKSQLIKHVPFNLETEAFTYIGNKKWLENTTKETRDFMDDDYGKFSKIDIQIHSYENNTWQHENYALTLPDNTTLDDNGILKVSSDGSMILVNFGYDSPFKYAFYEKTKTGYVLKKTLQDNDEANFSINIPENPNAVYLEKDTLKVLVSYYDLQNFKISPNANIEDAVKVKNLLDMESNQDYTYESDEMYEGVYLLTLDFNGYLLQLEETILKDEDLYASENIWSFNSGQVLYVAKGRNLAKNFDTPDELRESLQKTEQTPMSFHQTFVKTLTNENATNSTILKELKQFFKQSKPQDQIIVFFAGHGMLDDNLNYYFAPSDMNFNKAKERGLSFHTIVDEMSHVSAQNKLLLMDTCHSGNTLDLSSNETKEHSNSSGQRGAVAVEVSQNPEDEIKVSDVANNLLDDFGSTTGITILSASSGQDVAYEAEDISNGAFTTAYLNLLNKNNSIKRYSTETKKVSLTSGFIDGLYNQILSITNGKQKMDVREINNLTKISLW